MSGVPSLRELIDELDLGVEGTTTYVHRKTGEVVLVTEDMSRVTSLHEDVDEESLADWERAMLPKLREATTSEDYAVFSLGEELDEYRLMERFIRTVEDERVSAQLQRAIQGRGAFRHFKDVAREHGLLDAWFEYRDGAVEEVVARWLEDNGIPFTRP